jgi:hypothetical protein
MFSGISIAPSPKDNPPNNTAILPKKNDTAIAEVNNPKIIERALEKHFLHRLPVLYCFGKTDLLFQKNLLQTVQLCCSVPSGCQN